RDSINTKRHAPHEARLFCEEEAVVRRIIASDGPILLKHVREGHACIIEIHELVRTKIAMRIRRVPVSHTSNDRHHVNLFRGSGHSCGVIQRTTDNRRAKGVLTCSRNIEVKTSEDRIIKAIRALLITNLDCVGLRINRSMSCYVPNPCHFTIFTDCRRGLTKDRAKGIREGVEIHRTLSITLSQLSDL